MQKAAEGLRICLVISRRDRRASTHVFFIIKSQITEVDLVVFFFFLLFNQRAQANLYLRRGGMKGNKMGSGTGTTDLGMA